mmetsp:Transcript_9905/g.26343  ORF Transcript_9905/g.26343 Transcript_9905/m.26343 type:complete len:115 (-) Transcript_9905:19-363(-)
MSSKTTIPGVKTKVDMTPTFIVTGGFMRSGLRSNSRSDYGALRCGLRGTKAVATAMNIRRSVDYSVYLVTDRTIATRAGLSLEKVVDSIPAFWYTFIRKKRRRPWPMHRLSFDC